MLLDEMWSSEIAVQLRQRGHDVVAVGERLELRGKSDPVIFAMAQAEERAVVTENAIDYRPLAAALVSQGRSHAGLILTSNRRFPRHDARTAGRLTKALHELLTSDLNLSNSEHWLS